MPKYDADWFESVLDAMHDMVLVKGPNSHLLWANKAFRDLYGMTAKDLHQIIDAEHSDPDDTLQYVIDDQTVFDSGRDLDVPQEVVTDHKGRAHYYHTVKSPIFEDGSVARTVGVSRPKHDETITRRRIDHHDAKAFVAPMRALTQCFPNPMLMVDIKKRVLNSNALWNDAFGDPDRSPNRFVSEAYAAWPELIETIDECLCYRETRQLSVTNGSGHRFALNISPWSFSDGVLGGATITATDVSELFHRTEALQKANDELMQFSYRASHDLKGPLSTMKGLANFITEDIRDGDLDEALTSARQIVTTAERLENTVISMLDLARADLQESPSEAIDLSDLIHQIQEGLEQKIIEFDVRIATDLKARTLKSQPVRVYQIIENLVANGIKYRSENRTDCYVKISSEHVAEGVRLRVSDNGIGIRAKEQKTMFDLFSRFSTSQDGAGLGLAIVEKHVKAMGGRISVQSDPNGTEFSITLPDQQTERLAS